MHDLGRGVSQDFKVAARWFAKAAEQGNVKAQFSLAAMCFEGEGVVLDQKEAAKGFAEAAEQGLVDAQYSLALLYYEGKGVSQSISYLNWYRRPDLNRQAVASGGF